MAAKKTTGKKAATKKSSRRIGRTEPVPASANSPRLYTLAVEIIDGRLTAAFNKKNPVISRTIQIRGDQTLAALHEAIFDAFDRFDEHMYEFYFGKGPYHPEATRYVLGMVLEEDAEATNPPAGDVSETTIDSLKLKTGRSFGYLFDYGDDWIHQINVEAIDDIVPPGKFPKVIEKKGASPPQYP